MATRNPLVTLNGQLVELPVGDSVRGVNPDPTQTLTNNTVATTETVVAKWALPANYLSSGATLSGNFSGQVSSTATLAFKVRIGIAGTTADAIAATFTTSAAGVANQHIFGAILVSALSSTTMTAAGSIAFGTGNLSLVSAAFASIAADLTTALFVTVTLVQSVAQTYVSRSGQLQRSS